MLDEDIILLMMFGNYVNPKANDITKLFLGLYVNGFFCDNKWNTLEI